MRPGSLDMANRQLHSNHHRQYLHPPPPTEAMSAKFILPAIAISIGQSLNSPLPLTIYL